MPINWSLGQGNNALAHVENGMKIGQAVAAARDKRTVRKATEAFAADPDNPQALNALIAADPQLGFKAADYRREQAKARREQDFDGALGDYVAGNGAMLGLPGAPAGESALLSVAGPGGGASLQPSVPKDGPGFGAPHSFGGQNALAALAGAHGLGSAAGGSNAAPVAAGSQPAQADQAVVEQRRAILAVTGKPQSSADAAFLRMLQSDPKRALEIDSKMRDRFVSRLKDEHDALGYGLSALAGVNDPATYAARRPGIVQRLQPLIANIAEILPEQFPGEEGLRAIQMRGLDMKDQLAAMLSEDRTEAYIDNLEADNARADRNASDIMADRVARRGIQRRGQDIRSGDTRRGQDLRGSGGSRSGRGGRESLPVVNSPAEAMKLAPGTKFRTPDGRVKVR